MTSCPRFSSSARATPPTCPPDPTSRIFILTSLRCSNAASTARTMKDLSDIPLLTDNPESRGCVPIRPALAVVGSVLVADLDAAILRPALGVVLAALLVRGDGFGLPVPLRRHVEV